MIQNSFRPTNFCEIRFMLSAVIKIILRGKPFHYKGCTPERSLQYKAFIPIVEIEY